MIDKLIETIGLVLILVGLTTIIFLGTQLDMAHKKIAKYEILTEQQNEAIIKIKEDTQVQLKQQETKQLVAQSQIKKNQQQIKNIMITKVPNDCEQVRQYAILEASKLVGME